jgi:hypothetical protein
MSARFDLPKVPNALAKTCLFLVAFFWAGDQVRSTRVYPGERWPLYLTLVCLSTVAVDAKSIRIAIVGGLSWCLFARELAQEYPAMIYYMNQHHDSELLDALSRYLWL